jgi:hypothetical protein
LQIDLKLQVDIDAGITLPRAGKRLMHLQGGKREQMKRKFGRAWRCAAE